MTSKYANEPVCRTCGAMYEGLNVTPESRCRVCEDPRQYVPPTGHAWSTIAEVAADHHNIFATDPEDQRITSIWTEPKFAIGQRAILISTPAGNVLWDCITHLDQATIDFIKSKGGLKAIVVSHPHFYSTIPVWAEAFQCPVYTAEADEEWLNSHSSLRRGIKGAAGTAVEILPKVQAVICGGHFPGSMCLHWGSHLFIADTLLVVPAAHTPDANRLPGTNSFTFMWSIPNMIPLDADRIHGIWKALIPFHFTTVHGAFPPSLGSSTKPPGGGSFGLAVNSGQDVHHKDVRARVLESMQIQLKGQGVLDHALFAEKA